MSQSTDTHTLAGAYALDALTEIERAGFARHMATCDACATEVAELVETASRLGGAVSQTPPARLRQAVLAEVARTRQVSADRPARSGSADPQRWRRRAVAAAAAAVLAIAGTATVWVVEEQRLDQLSTTAAAEQAQLHSVLAAPDVRIRTTRTADGGTLTVAVAPSLDDGVVLLDGMPSPGPDKAYQLWLIRGSSPTSAGVMAAGAGGGRSVVHGVAGADALGVTIEPKEGSQQPSHAPLVGVPLT